jgi:hypothetical protein
MPERSPFGRSQTPKYRGLRQPAFETLEAPKGVVQEWTDVHTALSDAAKEFRLPIRIAFDKAKRLLRNRHIKAITFFRLFAISFGHLFEVGKHEVG